jgi:hypothetical protein
MAARDARGSEHTARRAASPATSRADRLLHALGVDPSFAESVLGDLAEELALRESRDGIAAARWWYAQEVVRSAPHLVWSAVRYGDRRQLARLSAYCAGGMLVLALAATAVLTRDGPPARLVAGTAMETDGIIVNNVRAVQLPVRVLDAAGHQLKADSVRFDWQAGASLAVSPAGVATCTEIGDATVKASLGHIATLIGVRCRPVKEIEASTWISLVAGEPERHLPFNAIGTDGRPVMQLRGAVQVLDSSVATLVGASIRPREVGETAVDVHVGDRSAHIRVMVHEPVDAFTGLRPDQRLVAVGVRLAQGDTVQWSLPGGVFWLKYIPRRAGQAPPTITLDGRISCSGGDGLRVYLIPLDEYGIYCVRHPGSASVTVAHGQTGAPVVDGWLALERVEHR